jgi:hypothetical protein
MRRSASALRQPHSRQSRRVAPLIPPSEESSMTVFPSIALTGAKDADVPLLLERRGRMHCGAAHGLRGKTETADGACDERRCMATHSTIEAASQEMELQPNVRPRAAPHSSAALGCAPPLRPRQLDTIRWA